MRSERASVQHIERTLETRLERREVPNDVPREQKGTAPVVVIPPPHRTPGGVCGRSAPDTNPAAARRGARYSLIRP